MPDEKKAAAAVRKSRGAPDPSPANPSGRPDTGHLAHRHLAAPIAAGELERLLRVVEVWAAVERRKVPPSKRKRELDAAAAAAKDLATKMRALGPAPLLQQATMGDPSEPGLAAVHDPNGPLATPLLDRANATQHLNAGIAALAATLADASIRLPSGKRSSKARPGSLTFGLKALLEIWQRHRPGVPPDQARSTAGRFGALARDLFAGPPCRFDAETVRSAVAALLPRGAAARQVLSAGEVVEARRTGTAQARLIAARSGLGEAIRKALEANGAAVQIEPWSNAVSKGATGGDLLIIIPDAETVLDLRNTAHAPPMTQEAVMARLVLDPLRVLDRLEGRAKPQRVAIVVPALPNAAHFMVQAWAPLYAARAALAAIVQLRARRPGWEATAVVAIQLGWGIDATNAGLPMLPPSQNHTAVAVVETLGGIGRERSGCTLDLYGSLLPVLQALPHPDVVEAAAEGRPPPRTHKSPT